MGVRKGVAVEARAEADCANLINHGKAAHGDVHPGLLRDRLQCARHGKLGRHGAVAACGAEGWEVRGANMSIAVKRTCVVCEQGH